MGNYDALLAEARSRFGVQPAPTLSALVGLLRSLGAVLFDFAMHRDELADEFVDQELVVGAYTLTESSILALQATEEEVENFTADPDEE